MRVSGGTVTRRRHKKVLKAAKGYRMTRGTLYKVSKESILHAGQYSFDHRRDRAGDFRRLWISRINAAVRGEDMTYSSFMSGLRRKKVQLNRQVLAELAVNFPATFSEIVKSIKD